MKKTYRELVEELLTGQGRGREPRWTESITVGSETFVEKTKAELGIKAIGREVNQEDGIYELKEGRTSYNPIFAGENLTLRPKNTYIGDISV